MPKRYRLTARAQLHGEIRESGYVFTLEDGERGPCKTVSSASPGVQIADHIGSDGGMVDVPLYEELTEEHSAAIDEAEAAKIAEADAAAAAAAGEAPTAAEPDDGSVELIEDNKTGDQVS